MTNEFLGSSATSWRYWAPCAARRMYRFEHVDLELSPHNSTQLAVYDICNQAFGRRHKWLAFIDPDEFLVRAVN